MVVVFFFITQTNSPHSKKMKKAVIFCLRLAGGMKITTTGGRAGGRGVLFSFDIKGTCKVVYVQYNHFLCSFSSSRLCVYSRITSRPVTWNSNNEPSKCAVRICFASRSRATCCRLSASWIKAYRLSTPNTMNSPISRHFVIVILVWPISGNVVKNHLSIVRYRSVQNKNWHAFSVLVLLLHSFFLLISVYLITNTYLQFSINYWYRLTYNYYSLLSIWYI